VRGGVPPSVNLVRGMQAGWRLERWDFDATRRAFERVAVQPVTRASG
jgi:hypothetical protein